MYCSISAFGSGERAAALPGYDLLLQAMSGLMSVTGEPDGRPLKVGAALIDMICGLFATNGILAALRARERDGRGQRVEVSLMDSALASLLNQASAHLNAGAVPGRMGNRHPSIAPYETFAAADGDFAVAVGNDTIFGRLCAVVGRPELAGDERFATNAARMEHRDELAAELEAAFATAPAGRLGAARSATRACPRGRSTTSRRPSPSRPRWACSPSTRRRRAHGALAAAPRRDAGGREPPAAAPGRALGRDPSLAGRVERRSSPLHRGQDRRSSSGDGG